MNIKVYILGNFSLWRLVFLGQLSKDEEIEIDGTLVAGVERVGLVGTEGDLWLGTGGPALTRTLFEEDWMLSPLNSYFSVTPVLISKSEVVSMRTRELWLRSWYSSFGTSVSR